MKKLVSILLITILLAVSATAFAAAGDWTATIGGVSGEGFTITDTADGVQFSGPTDGTAAFNNKSVNVNETGLEIKLVNIPGYADGAAGGKPQAKSFFIGAGFLNVAKDLNYGNKDDWKGFGVLAYILSPTTIKVDIIANNSGDWVAAGSKEITANVADGDKLLFTLKREGDDWVIAVNGVTIEGDFSNITPDMFADNKAYLSVWNNVADEVLINTFAVTKYDVTSDSGTGDSETSQPPATTTPGDAGTLSAITLVALSGFAMYIQTKKRK